MQDFSEFPLYIGCGYISRHFKDSEMVQIIVKLAFLVHCPREF